MSKTTFSSKCQIIGDMYLYYKDTNNENWREFFEWGDVGIPLAYMVSRDFAKATNSGKATINETWDTFCEMISIDPEGKYDTLKSAFDASPNPDAEE